MKHLSQGRGGEASSQFGVGFLRPVFKFQDLSAAGPALGQFPASGPLGTSAGQQEETRAGLQPPISASGPLSLRGLPSA